MNIGPYEIVSEIGRGGMGVVYKARDPQSGEFVAIKLLTGVGAVDPSRRMGLVREARVTKQLLHTNIVRMLDIGQHKGMLYLVMELLEGSSLERIIKQTPVLPLKNKLNFIIQLCCGLDFAHTQHILHRDIKPANIFISNAGPLKIVDFGIAKLTEIVGQSMTIDTNTRMAGTLIYMSPERLNGAPSDIRSELWSIGVTLYELLTYKLPFSGSTFGALVKSVENDPCPPLDDSMPLRVELGQILDRVLAKDPCKRYPSAGALAHDLEGLLLTLEVQDADRQRPQETVTDSCQPDDRRDADSYDRLRLRPIDAGKVRFRATKFTESGALEHIKQLLAGGVPPVFFGFLGFFLLLESWKAGLTDPQIPGAQFDWRRVAIALAFSISLIALLIYGARRANVTLRRKCRSCARRMARAGKTSRFVTSETEIQWGLNDCIAALQEGCYQDAAKLLSVHGTEDALVYSVIRYNLEFWECSRCADQSVLLITEDKINSKWQRRDIYHEGYKFAAKGIAQGLAARMVKKLERAEKA